MGLLNLDLQKEPSSNLPPPSTNQPVISCEKRNVMATGRLWHRIFNKVMKEHYPHLEARSLLADAASMIMLKNPRELNGVLVMDNLFGDMLSDQASGIIGSLGLAPSASVNGLEGGPALCEYRLLILLNSVKVLSPTRLTLSNQTNRSMAPHPTLQAKASPTPSPRSSPPPCSSATLSNSPTTPMLSSAP